jgi:hypothetical protein
MTIAIIGAATSGFATSPPLTFTHSLATARATNNTRCVVVCISNYSASGGATNTPISSVTYNGVAMTLGPQINSSTGSSAHACIAYIMDAVLPAAAGNYSVVVTPVGGNRVYAGPIELTGVDQTAGITAQDTLAQPNGSVTNPIGLITTTANANDFIVNCLSPGGGQFTGTCTGATGQTSYLQAQDGTSYNILTSTLQTTTIGGYNMEWTLSSSPARQAMVNAAFKTFVAPTSTLFWMGSEF